MKERSEIQDKYKWDLTILYKTDKEITSAKKEVKAGIESLKNYEGKLSSKQSVLSYFKENDELMKKLMRLDLYASMQISIDTTDSKALTLMEEVNSLLTFYSVSLAFVSPELSKLSDEMLDDMLKDKAFKDYDRTIISIKRDKPHTISAEKEKILAEMSDFTDYNGLFDKLTDGELKFEPIISSSGEKLPLTQSNLLLYSRNEDRNIRKQANENFSKGFASVNLTLCHNYISYVKKCDFEARIYNFNSAMEQKFFYDEIDRVVYDKLKNSLHKNVALYQNYLSKKAELLNIKDFAVYDIVAPIGDGCKYCLEYDDAVKIVKDMVKCFGKEYMDVVDRVFSERWVDVYPSKGKRNGAFSVSVGTGNPFMLLNHEKVYRSISTIAHELGHSVHSYFSEKHQPFSKAGYDYFVAEVASISNEILLAKHLLKGEKDVEARRCVLDGLIQEFNNNVFMAGADAELEEFAHTMVNHGEPLTNEDLNSKYESLLKNLYGGKVKIHEYTKYSWLRHSQFYSKFYLYKYATGFIAAANIAENVEKRGEEYVKNYYLKFLSSGSSADPISLLKIADVDMTNDETYKKAFEFYKSLVNSL